MPNILAGLRLSVLSALIAFSAAAGEPLAKARLEVFKARRELQLFDGDRLVRTYRVALGTNPIPAKVRQGDKATPEGRYFICQKNPQSRFHLSLAISYPGAADAERGYKAGLITSTERDTIVAAARKGKTPPWNTRLGGEVCIHGGGSKSDWTFGCVALENAEMDALFPLIKVGTPLTIHP